MISLFSLITTKLCSEDSNFGKRLTFTTTYAMNNIVHAQCLKLIHVVQDNYVAKKDS